MTWKGIRDTLLWMVVLLLIAVITAGGFAARWWAAKDDLLTGIIRDHLEDIFPNCNVKFDGARWIDLGHIDISHLELSFKESGASLVQIPRLLVEIDTNILQRNQRVVIRELEVQSPELYFIRDAQHRWNWEDVKINHAPSSVSPEWTIKNGLMRIGIESHVDGQTRFVSIQGIQVTMKPESYQRYQFEGRGNAEVFGGLQLSGLVDGGRGEWHVHGAAGDVRLGDSLLELAAKFSPEFQAQLAELKNTNQALFAQAVTRQTPEEHVPTAAGDALRLSNASLVTPRDGVNNLLRADLAIQFKLGKSAPDQPVDYLVSGQITHGVVSEMLLPLPLYDLEARFRLSPDLIEIRDLRAANGSSTLYVDGSATKVESHWAKNFSVRATQLRLDERIRNFLWGQPATIFDLLSPSGTFDIAVGLSQEAGQDISWGLEKFSAVDCRVLCDHFRYPVEKIRGEVKQDGKLFRLNLNGECAGRPVVLTGVVNPMSEERDFDVKIHVTEFPIDTAFRNAFQRPEQETIRHVLDSLKITGIAGQADVRVVRNHETHGRVLVCIDGQLADGAMNYAGFPYELTDMRGRLRYNPLERNTWFFENLMASHGTARIAGQGYFDVEDDPHELMMELAALQAPLDLDLERATTAASPEMKTAWNDFGIKGIVDIDKILVNWTPGEKCKVRLDGIHWTDGQLIPKALPYVWSNVSGTLQWDGSKLRIHSLQGDHNGTYLLVNGAVPESAYVQIAPGEKVAWRLFLDDKSMHIRKLQPDDELKRALPQSMSSAIDAVQLKNPVDLSLGLDVKGWTEHPELMTASWTAMVMLKDNHLVAGVPITGITGTVVHRGNWDGKSLEIEGYGELNSLRTLDMPFQKIQGPFLVKNNRLTLGTPRLAGNEPVYSAGNPYRQGQIRAALYGGHVGLDVDLRLTGDSAYLPYWMELNIYDVELGEWAREHKYEKLMGKVNGVVQTSGRGGNARSVTGQGRIQITPAALYELPVFAQMMSILSFRPAQPGDAAFKYAYAEFTIHDEVFDFGNIELVGDALKFGGQGTVGYTGAKSGVMELDFYSKANKRIPLIGPLVSGWVRVQVFGTTTSPVARIQPRIPTLDATFSSFMQSVESGQPYRSLPRPILPPTAGGDVSPN